QSLTDSCPAVSTDGTACPTLIRSIHGTNDVPVIGGVASGDVTEDAAVSAGKIATAGVLTIADADAGQSSFTAQASAAGSYGAFVLGSDRHWTYSADNSQVAAPALG